LSPLRGKPQWDKNFVPGSIGKLLCKERKLYRKKTKSVRKLAKGVGKEDMRINTKIGVKDRDPPEKRLKEGKKGKLGSRDEARAEGQRETEGPDHTSGVQSRLTAGKRSAKGTDRLPQSEEERD